MYTGNRPERDNHAPVEVGVCEELPSETDIPAQRLVIPGVEVGHHRRAVDQRDLGHVRVENDQHGDPCREAEQVSSELASER